MMENSIATHNNHPLKLPSLDLWLGLLGVANFLAGCWFLIPPHKGSTVYFWFVEFYSLMIYASLILFLISLIIIVLWLSRLTKKSLAKAIVVLLGVIITALCCIPAFGTVLFMSTLSVIGRVSQNHHYYYLVKYYDDEAPTYSFCESDAIGFSGHCRYIGWKGDDSDPKIYIDQNTGMITVKSEKPSFIWINSLPPNCINGSDERNEEGYPIYVGGCSP